MKIFTGRNYGLFYAFLLVILLPVAICAADSPEVDKYKKKLESPYSDDRRDAINALVRFGNRSVIPLIEKALKDEDLEVRYSAASGLLEFNNKKGIPVLKEILGDKSTKVSVKESIAYIFARSGDKGVVSVLIEQLNEIDVNEAGIDDMEAGLRERAKLAVGYALCKLGKKKYGAPVIIEILKMRTRGGGIENEDAAVYLGELGIKESVPDLIEIVKTRQDKYLVIKSVDSLGKLGDESTLEFLKLYAAKLNKTEDNRPITESIVKTTHRAMDRIRKREAERGR